MFSSHTRHTRLEPAYWTPPPTTAPAFENSISSATSSPYPSATVCPPPTPSCTPLPCGQSLTQTQRIWPSRTAPISRRSVATMYKYLAAVRAWHIAQGWPAPLSDDDHKRPEFSVRGMAKMQGSRRRRPPRPPVTLPMLRSLKLHLNLSNSFDACIWAMVTSSFFGLMRFGEVSVPSRSSYTKERYLSRASCLMTVDVEGRPSYARLRRRSFGAFNG